MNVLLSGGSIAQLPLCDRLRAALADGSAKTTAQVASASGLTVAKASAILNRLRGRGEVVKHAPWQLARFVEAR